MPEKTIDNLTKIKKNPSIIRNEVYLLSYIIFLFIIIDFVENFVHHKHFNFYWFSRFLVMTAIIIYVNISVRKRNIKFLTEYYIIINDRWLSKGMFLLFLACIISDWAGTSNKIIVFFGFIPLLFYFQYKKYWQKEYKYMIEKKILDLENMTYSILKAMEYKIVMRGARMLGYIDLIIPIISALIVVDLLILKNEHPPQSIYWMTTGINLFSLVYLMMTFYLYYFLKKIDEIEKEKGRKITILEF